MKRRMMMVVGVAVVSAVATGAAQDRPGAVRDSDGRTETDVEGGI